jgi:sodium/bile acid cotransporter 7
LGFLDRRYFIAGVAFSVGFAALVPGLGRVGGPLIPEVTVGMATGSIFLLAGLSLPTSALATAAMRYKEHFLIQSINLALIPFATALGCNALVSAGLLAPALRDGMVVMAALPTTVNMCVALSRACAGDEPLAIFNAVLGQLLGVVLVPPLLLHLVGTSGATSAIETLRKLGSKVLLPLLVGQALRCTSLGSILTGRKKILSRTSESCLLFIIFATFCDTFLRGFGLPASTLAQVFAIVLAYHVAFLGIAWQIGGAARLAAPQRITLTLTSTQKTLAFGLPLIRVVFANRPDLGLLLTPLLMQHPLQLMVGSLLSERFRLFAAEEAGGQKGCT